MFMAIPMMSLNILSNITIQCSATILLRNGGNQSHNLESYEHDEQVLLCSGPNKLTRKCYKQDPYESRREKTGLMSYANNKGADQPAHPRRLISAFVIRSSDSIIPIVGISEISKL